MRNERTSNFNSKSENPTHGNNALRQLLVNRRDAARMLGNVTTSTIRRLEKEGLLHPVRINTRSPVAMVFFKYEEVVALAHGLSAEG
jgi:hypothetical protein